MAAVAFLSIMLTGGCAMTVDNLNDAAILAEKYMRNDGNKYNFVVIRSTAREYEFGWMFYCYPEKYLLTRDEGKLVPGAGGIFVDRDGQTRSVPSSILSDEEAAELHLKEWRERHR